MSMDLSEFYDVFFEECYEGLDGMENGLLNLDTGAADVEEVNTIFRAAHSIKGGSATFDFTEIAEFTHVMETLLDQMRSGEREVSVDDVNLLLESVDCLRAMIDATKSEEPLDEARVDKLQKRLEESLENIAACEGGCEQRVDQERVPETTDLAGKSSHWHIRFIPGRDFLKSGNDPLSIVSGLGNLGDISVDCDSSQLPDLEVLNPEEIYLIWDISLKGNINEPQIREVFSWVSDDCELQIARDDCKTGNTTARAGDTVQSVENHSAGDHGAKPGLESKKEHSEPDAGKPSDTGSGNPEPKPAAKSGAKQKRTPGSGEGGSIRVGIEKIDVLINLVGELVITQSMLSQFGEDFDMSQVENLRDGLNQLTRNSRELQETAMQIRMLPISSSFNRFPRLVRDLSQKMDKKVELKISGENTELDKTVLEKIGDPLVHLVRNSMDHGLEKPDFRLQSGKLETGVLELRAFHEGGNIVIEVVDDGAGLNKERILAKAREKGLIGSDDHPGDDEIHNLIFQPGFSTADQVSDVSGRGVGMDVVRRNINELGGQVYVVSESGKGSVFTIRLPLTLAIIDGQLVRVGNETYIIPLLSIEESLQLDDSLVNRYKGKAELYKLREEYIPIMRLRKIFDIPSGLKKSEDGLMVVVETERRKIGLFVDELLGQQQIVIKSLDMNYRKVEGLSGATILGDGTVALILDVGGLIRRHLQTGSAPVVVGRVAA